MATDNVRPIDPHRPPPVDQDFAALVRGLVVDVGALATSELRRTERVMQLRLQMAAHAAALTLGAGLLGLVGVLGCVSAAVLAAIRYGAPPWAAVGAAGALFALLAVGLGGAAARARRPITFDDVGSPADVAHKSPPQVENPRHA